MSAISTFLNQIKTAIYGEQVRDAIHDSILQCYTDVTNAKTLADQSTTSANNAATSANSAATKANNAAQSATTAANTANAAANNADNAKEAANSAAGVATSAANQANDAASAANAAAQAANTAKDNADTATTAANTATEAANTAAESANTAATNATDAANAALTAKDDANNLLFTHGVVENASGSLVTFYDGADDMPMKKLEVSFEPVQDLHGYDHPWPGGGGKNKFNKDNCTTWVAGGSTLYYSGNLGTVNINGEQFTLTDRNSSYGLKVCLGYFAAGTYTFSVLNKSESGIINISFSDDEPVSGSKYSDTISGADQSSKYITFTISSPKYVYGGIYANSTNDLSFDHLQIEEGSKATEWTPYSNICPISGWTGVKAHRTNKNLLIGEDALPYMQKYIPLSEIGEDSNGKKYIWFGAAKAVNNEYNGFFSYIHFKENTQYTLILTYSKSSGGGSNMRIVYTDETIDIVPSLPDSTEANTKATVIMVSDPNKTIKRIAKVNQSGTTRLYIEESGIFEGVLTEEDFVPYEGNTYAVTFPSEAGTVYGGTLDVVSGELKVDWEQRVLDGTESWRSERSDDPNKTFYIIYIGDLGYVVDAQIITDKYIRTTIGTSSTEIGLNCFNSTARGRACIYIRPNHDGMSVANFKTWLSENPVTCAYKLATPIIYQLTPQEVKTFLGENNIFADAGDVNVDYIADTKLYIDNKFTELQALVLENVGG